MWINITPHSSCYKERIHLILCPFPLDFDRFGMEISGLMMTTITKITKNTNMIKIKKTTKKTTTKHMSTKTTTSTYTFVLLHFIICKIC